MPKALDWTIRSYVYEALVSGGGAPDAAAIAGRLGISADDAQRALQRLHDTHALVLDDSTGNVMMAPPLSAVPTDYQVKLGEVTLYANCAWDSLGIPAMLSQDAVIKARHPLDREIIRYAVVGGQLTGDSSGVVHFALPFQRWYDDIVDT